MNRIELEKEKKRLQEELRLNEELLTKISTNPEIEVAEALHDALCHANHTDGCSWGYENWEDKSKTTKNSYREKAKKLLKLVHKTDLLQIIEIITHG